MGDEARKGLKIMQDIFEKIYLNNDWKSDESVSGQGSTLAQTKIIREEIARVLDKYSVQTIIDIPCGDLNWLGDVVLGKRRYLGLDIVPALIERNKVKYGGLEHVYFSVSDITRDPLPAADLVLVRDLLGHFSNADVKKALKNLRASGSKYLLSTTFPDFFGTDDIKTGQWRPINLDYLWGMPEPLEIINEGCTEGDGKFASKSLGLWDLREMR